MKTDAKLEIIRDSVVRAEVSPTFQTLNVTTVTTSTIKDFSRIQVKPANTCIYCGSTDTLSREHVLAYALGGVTTVPKGSCKACSKITHSFETQVLRGPMQMVRYITGMPSRTKHKDVPPTIAFKVTDGNSERLIEVPREEAPILLPFLLYDLPLHSEEKANLQLTGVVWANFGADPELFARKHGIHSLEKTFKTGDATAFARLIAKTAYANAYIENQLHRLQDSHRLVNALMKDPDGLGNFVGTKPEPYTRYPEVIHRIAINIIPDKRLMFSEVQLFANIGAPTYLVILGTLKE